MSEDRLLSAIKAPESVKESEQNFDDTEVKINFLKPRIEKIREKLKELRHIFSILERNKIRKNLYNIENKKNLLCTKNKRD